MRRIKHGIKEKAPAFFGSFGYLFCCLQWLWVFILYLNVIQPALLFISSTSTTKSGQPSYPTFSLPGPIEGALLAVITLLMVAVTVYVFIKLPKNVTKASDGAVRKTVETLVPVVIKARHKKDTKKNRIKVAIWLIILMKVLLIIIPIVLTAMSKFLELQPVDYSIAVTVGIGLACLSTVFFALQYLLVALFRAKTHDY